MESKTKTIRLKGKLLNWWEKTVENEEKGSASYHVREALREYILRHDLPYYELEGEDNVTQKAVQKNSVTQNNIQSDSQKETVIQKDTQSDTDNYIEHTSQNNNKKEKLENNLNSVG